MAKKKKDELPDAEPVPQPPTSTPASVESPPVAAAQAAESAPKPEGEDHGRGVLRAAGVVGFMTILSRLTGLWRFRVIGAIFGPTGIADAFYFAFVFPNLTRRLFGEGAMTSAFVPVFSDRLAKGEKDAANKTASVLFWRLSYWLSLGCVAVAMLAGLARFVAPKVTTVRPEDILAIDLFIAMLPYMVFINLAAVLMAILNSLGHFGIPAFAPTILNGLMIAACYFGLPYFGATADTQVWALAAAVLAGGLLQVLIQFPPAFARGFRLKFSMDTADPGYNEVMSNFKPVLLLVAVFQLNVMIDNIIAMVFVPGDGAVTYLNMGTSVYQLPWSIFSLALGTAALPMLSKLWALNKKDEFVRTLHSALRMSFFLALPCTVGIMLLSEDIVRLLYGTGKFLEGNGEPIRRTAGVVMFSSLGLVFFSINSVQARALYAMKDMKTPTSTSAKSVVLNLALNLVFVLVTDMKESGIALASTISQAWQTWALTAAVRRQIAGENEAAPDMDFLKVFAPMILVSAALGIGGYYYFLGRKDWEGFWGFFAAAGGSLIPFWFMSGQYFQSQLKDKPHENDPQLKLGVSEEHWSDRLKFQYSIYTSILASAIMGFVVWAVRNSVPPEGHTAVLVLQRALVPVVVGVVVYCTAAAGAREYEELKSAFALKLGRRLGLSSEA